MRSNQATVGHRANVVTTRRAVKQFVAVLISSIVLLPLSFVPRAAAAERDWGVEVTDAHTVLDHTAALIQYDDGQNHVEATCPEQWWDLMKTPDGDDIIVVTDSGKRINASWTYCTVRQAFIEAKAAAEASGDERLASSYTHRDYEAFFRTGQFLEQSEFARVDLDMFSLYFREDNQTGEITLGIPHADTFANGTAHGGFHPGDTIYRVANIFTNHRWSTYRSAKVGFLTVAWGTGINPETGKYEYDDMGGYLAQRDLTINGEPSDIYDSRESQFIRDANGNETNTVWLEHYNKQTDGESIQRLYQYTVDIPMGQLVEVQLRNNFQTANTGNTVSTINKRDGLWRIPEVEVISVLDEDYRIARGMVTADGAADVTQTIEPREHGERYAPLAVDNPGYLPEDVFVANIERRNVWEETGVRTRIEDGGYPDYAMALTGSDWQAAVTKQGPEGYIEVDNDLDSTQVTAEDGSSSEYFDNVKLEYYVDPDTGEILLRKHLYRTFRQIPGAVTIEKIDDETGESLEGAQFEVWNADGTEKIIDEVFTTDAEGKINFFDTEDQTLAEALTDEYIRSMAYADDNGVFTTADGYLFEPGTYTLREVKAPEGYKMSGEPDTTVTIEARTNETRGMTVDVEIGNDALRLTGDLAIEKYGETGSVLAGADFVLYPGTEIEPDYDAEPIALNPNDSAVATQWATADDALTAGYYWLVETEAPAGYMKLAEPIGLQVVDESTDGEYSISLLEPGTSGVLERVDENSFAIKVTNVPETPREPTPPEPTEPTPTETLAKTGPATVSTAILATVLLLAGAIAISTRREFVKQ